MPEKKQKPTTKKETKKTALAPAKPALKPAVKKQTPAKQTAEKKKPASPTAKKAKYFEAVGRRKTATARVRLFTQGKTGIDVNSKNYTDYFKLPSLQQIVADPLTQLKCQEKFGLTIIVRGGGQTGQAAACRHGISRALVLLNPYFKKRLKKLGFLTRDPRMRERKKPGLKRARKAPQWSKR